MKLRIESYKKQVQKWPKEGYHLMAQYNDEEVIVYQSYRKAIGHFAVENQRFGGPFSLNRMTWIKPNFLWMMYRNGWGQKEGQEVVLAVHLRRKAFENYLPQSVYSTYDITQYGDREKWKEEVARSSARLQWDPDHDPYGDKLPRKAIQIGLRNDLIKSYAKEDILEIEDISDFVAEQFEFVKAKNLDKLMTPAEQPLLFDDPELNKHLKLQ
ncbi:MAG: DUF4291 domain-containing protein [Bacteroidota bacterium]